jgi:hypothetical protein
MHEKIGDKKVGWAAKPSKKLESRRALGFALLGIRLLKQRQLQ